jgi:hypothetical protein
MFGVDSPNGIARHAQAFLMPYVADADAYVFSRSSRVGGVQDQIENGVSAVLLDDPSALAQFARAICGFLADPNSARAIGACARERVRDRFLGAAT